MIDGKTVEKWQNGIRTESLYNAEKRMEEEIPDELHKKIMEFRGWVPMK